MKCPLCNAWALVLESRAIRSRNARYRRYECANLHRFTTEENVKKVLSKERTKPVTGEETTAIV